MSTISFFVAGIPKGQPRVKAAIRKGCAHAVVYDPGTADAWKMAVALSARFVRPTLQITAPVALGITFYMPRPLSHYKAGNVARGLKDNAPTYHTAKPDADNLAKAVMDALTNLGGIWHDDAQVAQLTVEKRYTNALCGAKIEIAEAYV